MAPRSHRRSFVMLLALAAAHLAAHPESPAARAELAKLIVEFPDEPELRLRRAEHCIEIGAFDVADSDLSHACKIAPREPRAFVLHASLALARGQLDLARLRLDAALALAPRDPSALIVRARVSAQLGDPKAAHDDYSAALAALPPRPAPISISPGPPCRSSRSWRSADSTKGSRASAQRSRWSSARCIWKSNSPALMPPSRASMS